MDNKGFIIIIIIVISLGSQVELEQGACEHFRGKISLIYDHVFNFS